MSTAKAILKDQPMCHRKMAPFVKMIRNMPIEQASDALRFQPQKAAAVLLKLLNSAVANAENNQMLDVDELKVSQAYVDQATPMKRIMARAKGRSSRILKRRCHVTIVVSEG